MSTRTRPVLVYDGDCGICTKCVAFVERHLSHDIEIVAWQDADLPALRLSRAECEEAVQWVAPGGAVTAAHIAVGDLLKHTGGPWWVLGALLQLAPFRWVASVVYKWIAKNRDRLPGGTPACAMPAHLRPGAARPPGERPPAA